MSISPARQLEMTPRQAVKRLESDLGLDSKDLTGVLSVDPRTLDRWLSGETYPQREARRRLVELLALSQRLCEAFEGPEGAREWMHASSRYLGGITPTEALRSGRLDRVEAVFEVLESGIFD
jgi:ribosome-binding protein aMBF1 (putative translation factor)